MHVSEGQPKTRQEGVPICNVCASEREPHVVDLVDGSYFSKEDAVVRAVTGHYRAAALNALRARALRRAARIARAAFSPVVGVMSRAGRGFGAGAKWVVSGASHGFLVTAGQ